MAYEAALAHAAHGTDRVVRHVDFGSHRPVDSGLSALQERYTVLEKLLSQDEPAAPADLTTALEAVIEALSLVEIEAAGRCEHSLAHLLLQKQPRGDMLMSLTARRLRWAERAADWSAHPIFNAVVARARAFDFIAELSGENNATAKALRMLRDPPGQWRLRLELMGDAELERTMARLLYIIHTTHPEGFSLLNRDALGWWNEYFSRPPARTSQARGLHPLLAFLVLNLPLGLWWGWLLQDASLPAVVQTSGVLFGALLAQWATADRVTSWWSDSLGTLHRCAGLAALAASALTLLVMALGIDSPEIVRALPIFITAIVVLQRIPACALAPDETRERVLATVATWLCLVLLFAAARIADFPVERGGAVLFTSGVLVSAAVCTLREFCVTNAVGWRDSRTS